MLAVVCVRVQVDGSIIDSTVSAILEVVKFLVLKSGAFPRDRFVADPVGRGSMLLSEKEEEEENQIEPNALVATIISTEVDDLINLARPTSAADTYSHSLLLSLFSASNNSFHDLPFAFVVNIAVAVCKTKKSSVFISYNYLYHIDI